MPKVKMEKIYSHADGLVHISSMGLLDPASTLCLDVDVSGSNYEEADDDVTCDGCKITFNALKGGMVLK